jgi:DNA replication and repair protein RecF
MQTSRNIIGALAGRETDLEIKYVPSGDDEADKFSAKLAKARAMDVLKGSTSVGPHRDDVKIMLNGVDARHYASSGEKKTIALAMKLAEVEFIKNMTGEKPIILLDDVFSTLDIKRSRALLGVTGDGSQCVITTPDLNALMDEIKKGVTLYEVSKGHARKAK